MAQTTHGGAGGLDFNAGTSTTFPGATGGTSSSTGVGGTGNNALGGTFTAGGGGGGAGATGGAGGNNGNAGSIGGAGGATPGAAGSTPTGTGNLGGGGGGGAHGLVTTTTTTNNSVLSGGAGGNGGPAVTVFRGGGGGGAGGYGVVANGNLTITNSAAGTISGGAGGNGSMSPAPVSTGSASGPGGGGGGDGGFGVQFTTGGTLTNAGTITGGNGGVGAAGWHGTPGTGVIVFDPAFRGANGAGGIGVVGSNLNVINSGTIMGGLSGDGVTRANAVQFFGGTNSLTLAPGSTIAGNAVAFSAADTLALGGSGSASFDAGLIGSQYQNFGLFQKTGDSTWTLTGTNSAAMPWTLNGGTLNVTGSLPNAAMTVNNGGTLAGTGTVGTTLVNSGGTFAPGSGTPGSSMTVSGNLTFQPGATFRAIASPQTASITNVTGTASLAGTAQASFVPGSYIQKTYTLLHASQRNGTFSSFSTLNLPAGFTASLDYSGSDVLMNLVAQFSGGSGGGLGACGASNQCAAGNAVTNAFNNGAALSPAFQAIYGQTGNNLTQALSLLSGESATGAQRAVFKLGDQFLTLMLDPFTHGVRLGPADGGRMSIANDRQAELRAEIAQAHGEIFRAPGADAPVEPRWSAWGQAFGGSNRTLGDASGSGSHDVVANTYGFAAGMDYRVDSDTVAGFAVAVGGTSWYLGDGLGGGHSTAFQAGLFGSRRFGPAYIAAAIEFSNHWVETDRYAFLGDHLRANFDVINLGGRVEAGYRFEPAASFGVVPYGAIQVQAFRMPGYSETDTSGVGFGLDYAAADGTSTRSELGARFDHLTAIAGAPVMLRGRLAWAHDWISNPAVAAAFQGLPGASFVVNGAIPPSDSALTSLGVEVWLQPRLSVLAKFDGEFADSAQTYGGTAKLRYTF